MTNTNLLQAMGRIDPKLIADAAPDVPQKKSTNKMWVKCASAVAACLVLVIAVTFITQYIPTEYNLNYSYVGANGKEMYIADENVWIYYVDNGDIERERVKLPCTTENVFITWKHLNKISNDVKLIEYKIISNGNEITSEFEGKGVVEYEQGDYLILNITVSEKLKSYDNQTALIESLKDSMAGYSNIDFDEVNVSWK